MTEDDSAMVTRCTSPQPRWYYDRDVGVQTSPMKVSRAVSPIVFKSPTRSLSPWLYGAAVVTGIGAIHGTRALLKHFKRTPTSPVNRSTIR